MSELIPVLSEQELREIDAEITPRTLPRRGGHRRPEDCAGASRLGVG